ncbi:MULTISPECIES: ZIP family metal transporter [unclassified Flavobacterium]|jgi:ZIP family zinc transporter|uniref:ZIP family metal transporter n=1 Tax=unclassified Flavobacterium TaxID=196869 RepID=UPI0025C1C26F|nr:MULTISPECIES: transporter [unclassified Flavobacterium]
MTPVLQEIILFSLLPVFTMILGGVIAIVKKPSGNVRSLILHFAAGVVFSVVSVEILPDIIKENSPIHVVIGFSLGLISMLLIRKFSEAKEGQEIDINQSKLPLSLLIAVAVDIFIDGLLLGISFMAGSKEGMLLAIALSLELLSLGMATSTELRENKLSKFRTIGLIVMLTMVFFTSAVLGTTLLSDLSPNSLEVILSFGMAALLFLVTEELLMEAHEEQETVWHTAIFFGGFLLFVILGMVV